MFEIYYLISDTFGTCTVLKPVSEKFFHYTLVTRASWAMLTMLMLVLILGLVGSGGSQQILTGGGTGKTMKLERQISNRIYVLTTYHLYSILSKLRLFLYKTIGLYHFAFLI